MIPVAFVRMERRKPNLDGSENPRWVVYWRDVEGKQRKRVFNTPDAADSYLAEVDLGGTTQPSTMRFAAFWDRWEQESLPRLTPKVQGTYQAMGRRLLLPYFGRMALADINRNVIPGWIRWAQTKAGAGTVAKAHVVLSSVMGYAEDLGLIQANPAVRMGKYLPKVPLRPERPMLTPKQVCELADEVHPEFRLLIKTMGLLGLRPSEAIGLKVEDVDLERSVLHIRRSVVDGIEGDTKTAKHWTIPLMGLDQEFADHIRLWTSNEKLFTSRNIHTGDWIKSSALATLVKRAAKRAGFPGVTAQSLRSIAASNITEITGDVRFAQTVLRHTSPVMTLTHYDKLTAKRWDSAIESLSAVFDVEVPG